MKKILNLSKKTSLVFSITCASLIVLLGACSKKHDPVPDGQAKFRIVNSVEGSNSQDFYEDNTKLSVAAVAYGDYSEYFTVTSGQHSLSFTDAGTQTVNAGINAGIPTGSSYTVFYTKKDNGEGTILGVPDDVSAASSGKAKVRFANLNSFFNGASGAVIVQTDAGFPLASDLEFNEVSNYYEVTPGVNFTVASASSVTPIPVSGATLMAGKTYTIWFSGTTAVNFSSHIIVQN